MESSGEMSPIAAGRLLRADLRRARELVGLTQSEVAKALHWSLSKVTRIESGDVGISDADLRALCVVLEVGVAATGVLVQRAQASRRRGWWHDDRAALSPALLTLIGLEADADGFAEFSSAVVPGLFQTPEYASAVLRTSWAEEGKLAKPLAIRLRRQAQFHEQRDPPDTSVVLEEATLYRSFGEREVMADQMKRLAEHARRPHVTLRILPFEAKTYHAESFTIIRSEVSGTVVHSEARLADVLFEEPSMVAQFEAQFAELWAAALDADRTAQLLHRVAKSYAAGGNPRPWLWD
ncbi:helix-turn-helix domain-containing protein [Actinoplanes subglobosus]|uniref:Helix-turn-helix domain-containing protein n=1 Tax=Actinoplanes subglobosus TaxID=1547892 RepID=A0ABV8IX81_9ACTN